MADSQPDDRPVAPRRSLSKGRESADTAPPTEQERGSRRRPRGQSAPASTTTTRQPTATPNSPTSQPGTSVSDNGVVSGPGVTSPTTSAVPPGPTPTGSAATDPTVINDPATATGPTRPRWAPPPTRGPADPGDAHTRPAGSQIRTAAEIAGRTPAAPTAATSATTAPTVQRPTAAGPRPVPRSNVRRARLRLSRVDPWSVMKTAFLLSIAFGIVCIVAVFIVYSVLGAAGVWDSINKAVNDVLNSNNPDSFNVNDYVGAGRVMGFTILVACVDVVLITAIATLGAFMYNLSASLLGGIEITLAED
jgi:Transmembrane domain of unknown function (DUF3566)